MHVISRRKLRVFAEKYSDAKEPLDAWLKVAKKSKWTSWADVQGTYAKASYYECCLIFNICGGSYRLVVRRSENWKALYVIGVYTHAGYDRDAWKESCKPRPRVGEKGTRNGH
jgi:mRNA interferase HigB